MIRRILPALLLMLLATGCAKPVVLGVSDERRVWVVREGPGYEPEVYRCADGAPVDQPPKPVCIRAPLARDQ